MLALLRRLVVLAWLAGLFAYTTPVRQQWDATGRWRWVPAEP